MAVILDGEQFLYHTVAETNRQLSELLTPPKIAGVISDPAQQDAAEELKKQYERAGLVLSLSSQDATNVETSVQKLADNGDYTGIILFGQQPSGLGASIPLALDIHVARPGYFLKGNHPYEPPLLKGIVELLGPYGLASPVNGLSGKHLVVAGNSPPTDSLLFSLGFLKRYNATPTHVAADSPTLENITRTADIIAATSVLPNPLTLYAVKEGTSIFNIADTPLARALYCNPSIAIASAEDIRAATMAASIQNALTSWNNSVAATK
jgi:5,10-methylene-tetrahydrofolate dehydrogenase/methenyl tetrahydrofolate cyclohydrolase